MTISALLNDTVDLLNESHKQSNIIIDIIIIVKTTTAAPQKVSITAIASVKSSLENISSLKEKRTELKCFLQFKRCFCFSSSWLWQKFDLPNGSTGDLIAKS